MPSKKDIAPTQKLVNSFIKKGRPNISKGKAIFLKTKEGGAGSINIEALSLALRIKILGKLANNEYNSIYFKSSTYISVTLLYN